jgi:hypothetical protein
MLMVRQSVPGHCLDNSSTCIHSPDSVVHKFRNIEVPLRIHRDGRRIVEAGPNRLATIATEPLSRSGDSPYVLCLRVDKTHSIIYWINDVKVPYLVEQHT